METSVDSAPSELAQRLERWEAHESVRRLIHEYSHAFDKRDLERFAVLWSEDATWSVGPGHEAAGLPAIREAVHGMWQQLGPSHHWSCSTVIDVHGNEAVAATDVHAVAQGGDGSWAQTAATYRDRFERRDGTWLFTRRATDIHRAFPIADPLG